MLDIKQNEGNVKTLIRVTINASDNVSLIVSDIRTDIMLFVFHYSV